MGSFAVAVSPSVRRLKFVELSAGGRVGEGPGGFSARTASFCGLVRVLQLGTLEDNVAFNNCMQAPSGSTHLVA